MFQTFEHTADLGLRVEAATLEELFSEAARGLVAMLVDQPSEVRPVDERQIHISGEQLDYLLFDWLSELLYVFDSQHWVAATFDVHLDKGFLSASVRGEDFAPDRHRYSHEVKAITYHDLSLQQKADGTWEAELIVDI